MEIPGARTLVLDVPGWPGHRAGQHVDVRLTAANGYSTQRSYSIASVGETDTLELTVQSVPQGEVSPYLVHTLEIGDEFELRGPIGGWFRWTEDVPNPVLLVGGGSGVVPLMAMLRQRVRSAPDVGFHLIYSTRTADRVYYADELNRIDHTIDGIQVDRVFTRSSLPGDVRSPGRLRHADLPQALPDPQLATRVYICGPSGFVEHAAGLLISLGHLESHIRTERFGPTGG
jgi:ferredoxin-NADP reductase